MKKSSIIVFFTVLILTYIPFLNVKAAEVTQTQTQTEGNAQEIDLKNEKIKTNYISMNTFIDTTNEEYKVLSQEEIETLLNSMGTKSFTELTMLDINHEEKLATIQFMVNEDDGNIDALISTGIYNFLKGIKEFVQYNIKFEVTGRYTDSNGRYMKKLLYTFTYKPETLISIDWDNLELSTICNFADETWDETNQELIQNNKVDEASLQIKIINILKYYVSEKIS